MYLLSHLHEGRWPMTVEVVETLEIMCNLIFTQINEKYHNAWIMKSLKERRKSVPEDSLHFLSTAVHTMRFTYSVDIHINSIWAGKPSDVQKWLQSAAVTQFSFHPFITSPCQLSETIVHRKTVIMIEINIPPPLFSFSCFKQKCTCLCFPWPF